jgi:hypothetical protein
LLERLFDLAISIIMKSLLVISLHFALFMSLAAAAKVSYEGAKAMRVAVGEDITVVADLISSLSLPTWKGAPQRYS